MLRIDFNAKRQLLRTEVLRLNITTAVKSQVNARSNGFLAGTAKSELLRCARARTVTQVEGQRTQRRVRIRNFLF